MGEQSSNPPSQSHKTLVIACGALARELIAAKTLNKLDHLDITCLPAIWHNRPEKIPDGVRKKIRKARVDGYANILCLYGDCGTGGLLDKVLEEEGVTRIEGDHCYAFYSKHGDFDKLMDEEIGSFFLTDYLVRHFDRLIIQGLGLDRYPQLLGDIFGHYKRVVYLAQMPDAALEKKARKAAERLGLAFEMR
ncbi:MAG: DUF1638 domain-containing protein, partial [Alphaproteobacteria bacterium]|nr:DUF1638 domain-containing protein [Alphaproteobacteria bacterium]